MNILFYLQPSVIRNNPLAFEWVYLKYKSLADGLSQLGVKPYFIMTDMMKSKYSGSDSFEYISPSDLGVELSESNRIGDFNEILTNSNRPEARKFIEKAFNKIRPDAVFTWNFDATLKQICKEKNIPLLHQELGLIRSPVTLYQVDFEGLLWGSSLGKLFNRLKDKILVSDKLLSEFISQVKNTISLAPQEVFNKLGLSNKKQTILIPLQVEDDSNIVCGSPFKTMKDFVSFILNNLSNINEYQIIIKQHPWQPTVVLPDDIKEHSNIVITGNKISNIDLINASDFVFTINSTTGFEALVLSKPVFTFGKSPFSHLGFTTDINNKPQTINPYHIKSNKEELKKFLYFTIFHYHLHEQEMWDAQFYSNIFGRIVSAKGDADAFYMVTKGRPQVEWTGERWVPLGPTADTHYEHLHRYAFALSFVKDKKVLDLGSGEGYGSFIFSKTAQSVIGIDIDPVTIKHATSKYTKDNLRFKEGDVRNIPIKGQKLFDVIICFEVIEHIKEHDKLLKEVKRLLKDDGIFIVSSPNKALYSDERNYQNPYHLKELYFDGLVKIINKNFKRVSFFGQRIFPSSNIWPLKGKPELIEEVRLQKTNEKFSYTNKHKKEPYYFIAVASNIRSFPPVDSYLVDTSFELFKEKQLQINNLNSYINSLNILVKQKDGRLSDLQREVEELGIWGRKLDDEIKQKDKRIVDVQNEVEKLSNWGKQLDKELHNGAEKSEELNRILGNEISQKDKRIIELQNEITKLGKWETGLDEEIRQKNQSIAGLNQSIVALNQSIADKERIIKSLETTVTTNINLLQTFIKDHITKLEAEIDKRQKHLDELIPILNSNKEKLNELGTEFAALRAQNAGLENKLSDERAKIGTLEKELTQKDENILGLQKQLDENILKIKELDKEVVRRGEWGVQLQKEINEKNTYIVKLQKQIDDSALEIKEMDKEIVTRGEWGMRLQKEIDEKNPYIVKLQRENQERGEWAMGLQKELNERNIYLAQLEANLKLSDAALTEIYSSHGWRFLSKYYRLRNFILPIDSRRRRIIQVVWQFTWNAVRLKWLKKKQVPSQLWEPSTRQATAIKELPRENQSAPKEWKTIEFPIVNKPNVSIVIPVWNKCEYTYKCLESLLENTGDVPYEVIIVDNASTDTTPQMLAEMKNIKVIRNDANLGFVGACNKGAELSNGEYILLLNNDTKVTKGWLKAMVDLAQKDDKIGLVGAKLVYPDGRLQEAGGIIWNDPAIGIAWNYGRLDDPNKWEYNYVKEVDYCSGACLLVRKSLIKGEDLFDTSYAPAYCEDTDLAFRVRQKGYKVIYQPKAEIIHYEGITAGTDTAQGIKKYQVINTEKFYRKWQAVLEQEHFKNAQNTFLARDRSRSKKIMLFMDNNVPTWDQDAGSVRMYEYLKIFLNMGFKIIFWPHNLYRYEPYGPELQQMGIELVYGPQDFKEYIKNYGKYIDVAFLTRPDVSMPYIDTIKSMPDIKVLYDLVDLYFLREERKGRLENDEEALKRSKEYKSKELYLIAKSDVTLTLSPVEKEILAKEIPDAKTVVVPYIQEVSGSKTGFNRRNGLLFLGGFQHPPNADGIKWFIKEIYPLVKLKIPDMTLTVIGSKPTPEVLALNSPENGIKVIGYVKDVTPYFENARVFVSPLRYGAGIKGKNIQAMSFGLPMVTTAIGAEGLNLTDGQTAFIADRPADFAQKAISLYKNNILWDKISKQSIQYVKMNNSSEYAEKIFRNIFSDVGIEIK